jgi:hypothetical protein
LPFFAKQARTTRDTACLPQSNPQSTYHSSLILPAKRLSHLPILVGPSHGTGKRDYVWDVS